MYHKWQCIQTLLYLYQQTNTLVDTLREMKFHFDHLNFPNKSMFIKDAKVKKAGTLSQHCDRFTNFYTS